MGHGESIFQSPELWVAVGFVLLIVLIWKPVSTAILGALDARAEGIRKDIEEAARLREQAQQLLADLQRKQRDALKEAEAIVAHAKSEAELMAKRAEAELDTLLKRREQLAMQRIQQAEAQALVEVRAAVVDVAMAAAGKLIGDKLAGERADALIDEAIRDLPRRLSS